MPVGTFFQTVPSSTDHLLSSQPTTATTPTPSTSGANNAATQLSDAIDEFLADVEKKFKIMNDEILTKCTYQD
jgi:BMFP domain-containing protein YqiC